MNADSLSQAEELSAASTWCRQFAIVNAMGLRKIAKKHDKYASASRITLLCKCQHVLHAPCDTGHLLARAHINLVYAGIAAALLAAASCR
jgi:SPX domain protein involved in polyphosphate accumulation